MSSLVLKVNWLAPSTHGLQGILGKVYESASYAMARCSCVCHNPCACKCNCMSGGSCAPRPTGKCPWWSDFSKWNGGSGLSKFWAP